MRFRTFIYKGEVSPFPRVPFHSKTSLPIVLSEFPLQGEYTFLDGNFLRLHPLSKSEEAAYRY